MTRFALSNGIVSAALLLLLSTSANAQQSLGDVAREARKSKPAEPTTKVITNDDLGSSPRAAEPSAANAESDSKAAANSAKAAGPSAQEKAKAEQEKAKGAKDLQDKIAAERDNVTKLQGEIDKLQQQTKQRASNFYADAGTRLRDPKKYADDVQKDKDDIAAKQKELEDAKTKLGQLEDEARKSEY